MVSRRDVLAAGGTAVATSIAGCPVLGQGSGTETEYHDWFGPEVADAQARVQPDTAEFDGVVYPIRTANVPEIRSNDRLDDAMVDRLTWYDAVMAPIAESGQRESVDVHVTAMETFLRSAVGSFDRDALVEALPDRASRAGNHRDHELYTMAENPDYPDRAQMAYALGTDSVVRTAGIQADWAVELAEAFLDTGDGDADRFADTHDTTEEFVERLGTGDWTEVHNLGSERPTGIRIDLEGEGAERTMVTTFESEAKATESVYTNPGYVDMLRRTPEDESRSRVNVGKHAPYENFDHSVEGRTLVMTGRIPTEKLTPVDLQFP